MNLSRRTFVRTLFIASQASLVGANLVETAGATTNSAAGSPDDLKFLVLGDWGRKARPDQQQVAEQMGIRAAAVPQAFVVAVGDNFYEIGVESIQDEHWKKSFEDVYAAKALQVPWYVILGNHDYVGNTEAQLQYAKNNPRWIMPARYYSKSMTVGGKSVDLFFLDTCPAIKEYHDPKSAVRPELVEHVSKQDWGAQLAWITDALHKSQANWKLVFGHHPIYSGGLHGDQPELVDELLPLLQKTGVQAYFCGHDHDMQHLSAPGVDLFVSGGGSEHRLNVPTEHSHFSLSTSGFMAVSLAPDRMHVEIIDNNGSVLYQTTALQTMVAV